MEIAADQRVPALDLTGLTKRYDDGLLALDGFELELPQGEFFGLLGPNGAGKTTLISAVCNLIRVTAGDIRVFGHDHRSMEARRLIGLAEQDVNLDRFLDVEETLLYHGGYYRLSRARARARAREMMDVFDLASCTSRAWSSWTSQPRGWTSSCGWSCGATSAGCTRPAPRSS